MALAPLAALLLLTTACGGGDDDQAAADESDRSTTTTAAAETTTTLSPRQQEEQAVREAHEAAVQARIDSAAPPAPDPNFPAVAQTHTGPMLDEWVANLEAWRHNSMVIRYPPNSQHRNEIDSVTFDEIDGQQVAYAEVCVVDDGVRVSTVTGEVLAEGVRTIQATEALRKEGGVWKVAELRQNSLGEGVTGCAAD